ncbi:MAG: hypothetical protein ACRC0G_06550 [Fusobacteriaceae bacterium]
MDMNNASASVNGLTESAAKYGTTNYLLGVLGFVILSMMIGLGFIIKQNSDAISSIPRDLALLTQKLDSMDRKIDMIFMERFDVIPKVK